jgi:hypothetical protein
MGRLRRSSRHAFALAYMYACLIDRLVECPCTRTHRDNYEKAKEKKQKNLKLSDAEAKALELSDVKSLKQLATDMAATTGKKITK